MIQNYIKVAVRTLLKQKGLAFINVLSLSVGIACFSLFLLYSVNEFSFDRFHKNADRLYRVYRWSEALAGQEAGGDYYMPMPLGPAMQADFPEVENYVRLRTWGEEMVRAGSVVQRVETCLADPQVLDVFSFPLVYGNAGNAFKNPSDMVLTQKAALRLFGEANPTGRTLEMRLGDEFVPFTVTAVARDLPVNSSIQFEMLGNFQWWENHPKNINRKNNWNQSAYETYVLLRPGSNLATDKSRLLDFRKKHYPDEEAELRKGGYWKGEGAPLTYRLQALRTMHTDRTVDSAAIDPKNIWVLLSVASGLLLIACINFTTLAVGRSASRAREVGVRKVVGSSRSRLIGQFMTEAMLLALVSGGLGLLLMQFLQPYFNDLSGRELHFSLEQFPEIGWLTGGLVLLTGVLAGSYPALALSGFRPVEVLRSKVKLGGSNLFTKSLVTLQFVMSVGLIAATLIILKQISFMQGRYPGFNKENIVVVDADGTDSEKIFSRFRQALEGRPEIAGVTGSELSLGAGMGWSRSGWNYQGQHKEAYEYFVDPNYLDVMGISLLGGRNFDPAVAADTINSVIVNESFARDFGWTPQTALGQSLLGYYEKEGAVQPVVIGVVKDFNFRPLKEAVKPQLFHQFSDYAPFKFLVRIRPGDPAPALSLLAEAWKSLSPDVPFKYSFMDEDIDKFYRAEQRWSKIIGWAGGISIFLACLGLFGLATLAAANRTKEIGIRRVLGASLGHITGLLSGHFIKLVLIALAVASPLAWYIMEQWLENFAYRVEIQWWMFAGTGLTAVGIAYLTVGAQSLKAALANPVNSLRNE